MASAKLSGPPGVSPEDDGEDQADIVPVSETDGETVAFPVFYQTDSRACNPYYPFSDSNSDSGSVSCPDAGPDPDGSFIDFFDESYEVGAVEEFYSDPDPGLRIVGDFNLWGFPDEEEDDVAELGLGLGLGPGTGSDQQRGDSGGQGLRVTGIDSDSDFEDGVFDLNASDDGNGANASGRVVDGTGTPPVWDSFFGEEAVVTNEELEWEEVQNAITWTHEPVEVRVLNRPEEEEELSSSSRISSRDDHEHDLDWQVLLAVNNVVNYIEQAEGISITADDIDANYYMYLASIDEYGENHGDFDAIFGQMLDTDTGISGSPPAAKRVVEDLPLVELTVDDLGKGDIVCAVCKDEMAIEEKVRRLPCRHFYHEDCILPWLGIRNTCPVCRHELPTDDPEYESARRLQRSGSGLARELSGR
ncbi:PREDICTED: E3 ubiquitin-protein ligase Praja-1 [Tarenaya hassleriana]|uniref:RING-type E3 ubiquitin transferase n=1 Tax=Tarenaya spinosa TaxID=228870 RepID=Q1KUY2_9ROSI|nr:PREDICTED: E3 ubiquitin-protein ligase Praja-1 [Tarenaya hassleriana]ABD96854.1 hypothetical protein [Tarenaya spinosa]